MGEGGIHCVVGLGNPGRKYERTRHNLGFWVADALVARWSADGPRQAFGSLVWDARRPGGRVLVQQPQTFMNCSGRAVRELMQFYKIAPADVLVVLDDMALPPGKLRLRPEGSAGGHNGLADVIEALGTTQVARLRIGIGEPPGPVEGVDYVLGVMSEDELAIAREATERACEAVEAWLSEGDVAAMNRYN